MQFNDEVSKIVIRNIDLLEDAPNIIREVEKKIFKAINEKFETFFSNLDGWNQDGVYTYYSDATDAQTTFSAVSWPLDDEDYAVYYEFCESDDDEFDPYHLSILTGTRTISHYGIFFSIDLDYFGVKKSKWKAFLREQYQARPQLAELGVSFEGQKLCIPIVLDATLMAEEYPDFDTCLEPIENALAILMKAHPYIDEIVQETRKINVA